MSHNRFWGYMIPSEYINQVNTPNNSTRIRSITYNLGVPLLARHPD